MARIISFGDSWAQGCGLENMKTECYTGQLSDRCNIKSINWGSGGNSFKVITSQILQHYEYEQNDIVLLCLPPDIRDMGENSNGHFIPLTISTKQDQNDQKDKFVSQQLKYFTEIMTQFQNWSQYHLYLNLFAVQSYFKSLNIPYIFFTNYGYIDWGFNFNAHIDRSHLLSKYSLTTLLGGKDMNQFPNYYNDHDGFKMEWLPKLSKNFIPFDSHPSKKGHKIIADTIYNHKMFQQWLMSTTNTEN